MLKYDKEWNKVMQYALGSSKKEKKYINFISKYSNTKLFHWDAWRYASFVSIVSLTKMYGFMCPVFANITQFKDVSMILR